MPLTNRPCLNVASNLTVSLDAHVVGAVIAEGGITVPADLVIRGTNGEWLVLSTNGASVFVPLRLGGTNSLPHSSGGATVAAILLKDPSATNANWSSALALEYYSAQVGHTVTNCLYAYEGDAFCAPGLYREDGSGAWHRIWDAGTDGEGSGLNADLLDGHHDPIS